jgi:hypothetical protein
LEIGIDVSSLPLETVHMLKDLNLARDNLAKKGYSNSFFYGNFATF